MNNISTSQVVIDDLIPVKNNEPVFVHSTNSGEMWPCLLEKAYSKLQGSYCHLNGGMPLSAMVDFSGGFPLVAKQGRMFSLLTKYYLEIYRKAWKSVGVQQQNSILPVAKRFLAVR